MLLAPFEVLLNRNIAASGAARIASRRLAGKTLAVHINAGSSENLLSLYFQCANERITIATKSAVPATAALFGTPLAYLGMLRGTGEAAIRSGGVRIEGDAEAAQAFRDLLEVARPDVEEELARIIGDVPAHQLGNVARETARLGRRVFNTFAQNISEYLQEESRDLATRIEVDEFAAAVDKLRDDVDRAEARLKNILQVMGDA